MDIILDNCQDNLYHCLCCNFIVARYVFECLWQKHVTVVILILMMYWHFLASKNWLYRLYSWEGNEFVRIQMLPSCLSLIYNNKAFNFMDYLEGFLDFGSLAFCQDLLYACLSNNNKNHHHGNNNCYLP